jgi:hypothetical protein
MATEVAKHCSYISPETEYVRARRREAMLHNPPALVDVECFWCMPHIHLTPAGLDIYGKFMAYLVVTQKHCTPEATANYALFHGGLLRPRTANSDCPLMDVEQWNTHWKTHKLNEYESFRPIPETASVDDPAQRSAPASEKLVVDQKVASEAALSTVDGSGARGRPRRAEPRGMLLGLFSSYQTFIAFAVVIMLSALVIGKMHDNYLAAKKIRDAVLSYNERKVDYRRDPPVTTHPVIDQKVPPSAPNKEPSILELLEQVPDISELFEHVRSPPIDKPTPVVFYNGTLDEFILGICEIMSSNGTLRMFDTNLRLSPLGANIIDMWAAALGAQVLKLVYVLVQSAVFVVATMYFMLFTLCQFLTMAYATCCWHW